MLSKDALRSCFLRMGKAEFQAVPVCEHPCEPGGAVGRKKDLLLAYFSFIRGSVDHYCTVI